MRERGCKDEEKRGNGKKGVDLLSFSGLMNALSTDVREKMILKNL